MCIGQEPEEGSEGALRDEPDVQLVAGGLLSRRAGHRVGSLDELAPDVHTDGEVLAGLEVDRLAVEGDPEVTEALGQVDPPRQVGVVEG